MCSLISSIQSDVEETDELYLKICKTEQDDIVDFLKDVRNNPIKTDVFLHFDKSHSSHVFLSAHKEVLAAASPYLAELLLQTSNDCDVHISFSEFK